MYDICYYNQRENRENYKNSGDKVMEIIDKKSKRTEEEIIKNLLTGLLIPQGFMEEARLFFSEMEAGAWCMVSIDILHFRLFNKFHGRSKGDQFLRYVADCLDRKSVV